MKQCMVINLENVWYNWKHAIRKNKLYGICLFGLEFLEKKNTEICCDKHQTT